MMWLVGGGWDMCPEMYAWLSSCMVCMLQGSYIAAEPRINGEQTLL